MFAFQQAVREELLNQMIVHMDYILIPATDEEERLANLDKIMGKLRRANMTVNLGKCK